MKSMDVHRMPMRTVTVLLVLLAVHANAIPSGKGQPARSAAALMNDSYRPFLINNIFNYYGNNGDGSYNKFSLSNEGLEFPKGSDKHIIFEDGLLWGGMHKGRTTPKVGGSVYRHALQAGPLLTTGTPTTDPVPADPSDPGYRIYRVRPDIRPDIPFASVERSLSDEEVPYIARYEPATARGLFDQYIADWNEWPAALGAPFTDVDKNGVYDPAVDIPGRPGADQTLWYVANDMNDSLTQILAGCPPIGLEMHRTIWGYRGNGALGNTIFTSTVLINKSGAPVDSMYITQWSDTDLGDAGDDHVGCDTTLDLAYTYNGQPIDPVYGRMVPAAGFVLIQGPMVAGAPTDTALFLAVRRPGFRNLRMSSFVLFTTGWLQFADPAQGVNGDVQWYHLMNGTAARNGDPFTDLHTNRATKFCVSGDPVQATDGSAGWVDGLAGMFPSDRRSCMATGPFTLANGDTQEVIIATLASQGPDRIASVGFLRSDVRAVRTAIQRSPAGRRMPPVSCSVASDSATAVITCRIDARNDAITAASVSLTTHAGAEVATVTLADDGLHADEGAADGIWGGTTRIPVRPSVLNGSAVLTYAGGEALRWENVLYHITTTRLAVESYGVASDNINSDGIVNPGENIRYLFALRNESPFDLTELNTHPDPLAVGGGYTIPVLPAHAAFRPQYDANDAVSYFLFDVPAGYTDSTMHVEIRTTDDSLNVWRHTLVFHVSPLPATPYATPLAHATGKASGAYTIQIVDPARIKDHFYVVRGVDSAGAFGSYTVKDSTTGAVLIAPHAIPDVLGHTSPVVDGFKVLRGTIDVNPGMASWDVPSGTLRFSPVGGFSDVGLEGFTTTGDPTAYEPASGTIGAAMHFRFGSIRTRLGAADHHTVLLRLAAADDANLWDPKAIPADTNFSRAYRYLRGSMSTAAQPSFVPWIINQATGYPYQSYDHSVPFSAWDMDVDPPVRLAVGHLENNALGGRVDGRYWPGDTTAENFQTREFAFIFRSPYTETPDPALTVNLQDNATTPLMWVMTCNRASDEAWVHGDEFLIAAHHFPTAQDAWVFNPSVVAGVRQAAWPSTFALLQNYPNPFNPSTTIRYELPAQGMVTVTVFDILGRAVRHVIREVQPAGSHAVLWHGDTDAGGSVASGVYFYRCTIERSDDGGQFDQTMKMILLR